MLYAALAQCPVIGGKPTGFDAAKAKAMPGVKHVVQISDGVAVVADTWWRAKTARDALTIQWDEGAGKALNTPGMLSAMKAAAAKPGAVIKKQGDVDAAFKGAAKTVQADYELPFLAHATMEPMNFTADVQKDSCLVYGPTQFQQLAAGVAAAASGLKPEQVTVRTTFLGGGFGRRIDVDFIAQAVEISKAIGGGPVKLVWTREDDMTHDFYRPMSYHQLSGALDAQGKPVALKFHLTSSSVTSRLFPPVVKDGIDPFMTEAGQAPVRHPEPARGRGHPRDGPARRVLALGLARAELVRVRVVHGRDGAGRGPGPLRVPPRRCSGSTRASGTCSSWRPRRRAGASPAPKGRARGIALMEGYGTAMAQVAEVSVGGGGVRVHRVVVAADPGRMVNPNIVRQQLESSIIYGLSAVLYGEVTLEDGRVQQANFDQYPVAAHAGVARDRHPHRGERREAGRHRRAGHGPGRPRCGQRGVRGDGPAAAQAAAEAGLGRRAQRRAEGGRAESGAVVSR